MPSKSIHVTENAKNVFFFMAEWSSVVYIYISTTSSSIRVFSGASHSKESSCSVGDPGSIPGWEDPLEKEMATHSSILAWRIPWTEELGGL